MRATQTQPRYSMDFPPGRTDDAGGEGSGSSRMESPRRRQIPGASRRGWRALSKREVVAIALADVQRLASADQLWVPMAASLGASCGSSPSRAAACYCGWHAHCQRHVHSNAAPFPDAGSVVAEDPGSHLQQQHYALSNLRCFMILWHLRDWPFRTVTGCQEAVTHRAWAGDLVGYLCVLSAHCSLCMVQQGHCRVAPGLLG
mmetsp:Transcript_39223/g.99394  ORF Transcript_39223/g.99394 Transcript_39223/m.99394 type:complete len:202 (+) Transcript_39223:428-1033(+)